MYTISYPISLPVSLPLQKEHKLMALLEVIRKSDHKVGNHKTRTLRNFGEKHICVPIML